MARSGQRGRRKSPHLQLIALRVNSGLSREALGYRIGVGRETIRLAESGFTPTPRVQFALASEFGMTPLDLWPIEAQRRPR
jgi:DNA-binding XRE family transcriptional regulator